MNKILHLFFCFCFRNSRMILNGALNNTVYAWHTDLSYLCICICVFMRIKYYFYSYFCIVELKVLRQTRLTVCTFFAFFQMSFDPCLHFLIVKFKEALSHYASQYWNKSFFSSVLSIILKSTPRTSQSF